MTIFLLIVGLLLFVGLVVAHEFGHFIMARRNGVDVEEFGIGFPPRAKALTKKKGTVYTLNWLPLGGFVKLKGEHDADTEPGTYGAAPLPAKVKIMMAGVAVNLGIALILFTILAFVGMPVLITKNTQGESQFTIASDQRVVSQQVIVNTIEPDSPAQKAGLNRLDSIRTITGEDGQTVKVATITELQVAASERAGQEVKIVYARDHKEKEATLTLRPASEVIASAQTDNPKGYMGVSLADYQVNRYTWSAPVVAVGLAAQLSKLTVQGIGSALAGLGKMVAGIVTGNAPARQAAQEQATGQVSGPLGIFFVLKVGANQGIAMIIFVVAIISLGLAIMNVLPIPALDGGRLFVTLLYRALNKPLTERAEELIHGTGFAALMVLFALITLVDIKRFL